MMKNRSADAPLVLHTLIRSLFYNDTRRLTLKQAPMLLKNDIKTSDAVEMDKPTISATANLQANYLPSTRISRLYEFGKLGVGLAAGSLSHTAKSLTSRSRQDRSSFLGQTSTAAQIVSTLSRMRGAALKIGQMLSINEMEGVPDELQQLFTRLQASADYMPTAQLNDVMAQELGPDWRARVFKEFCDIPIAAASIGQVHQARLNISEDVVAVKVQYPGVADSVMSDLKNLSVLLTFSGLLPKGLFLDNTIRVAQKELLKECDYLHEAQSIDRFRQLLDSRLETAYQVPRVFHKQSTKRVLVTEFMPGVALGKLVNESQKIRDHVGESVLRLCMMELFGFKFMQTDPNWSNFLFDKTNWKLNLIDFGASREFDSDFIEKYRQLLMAAARHDGEKGWRLSVDLGFLTGSENQVFSH